MDPAWSISPAGARLRLVTLDNPPVNGLGHALRRHIVAAVDAAEADPDCAGIIVTGAGKLFCAGADVREFGTEASTRQPDLRQVLARLFACRKPVIAAIHGTALGGGLELAMACHYRVAEDKARFGLPEVNLGLIPGAWGTQMLPRLTSLDFAVEMVCRGTTVPAQEAAAAGLVDAVAPTDPVTTATAFFDTIAGRPQHPDTRQRSVAAPQAIDLWQSVQESRLREEFPGCPAPVAGVRAIALAATLPFEEAVLHERQAFVDLMASPESAALRHIFFAERQCARVPETKVRAVRGPVAVAPNAGGTAVAEALSAAFGPASPDAAMLEPLAPITVPATGTTIVPARLHGGSGGNPVGLTLALRDGRPACIEASGSDLAGLPAVLGLGESLGVPVACTPAAAEDSVLAAVATALCDGASRADAHARTARTLRKLLATGHFYRAADGDVLAVHAFSYPRHLGGPLYQDELTRAKTKEPQQ